MTIEVLGTVLGIAIQGQIVGGANAPCINHTSILNGSNITMQPSFEVNVSHVTLEDTVSVDRAKERASWLYYYYDNTKLITVSPPPPLTHSLSLSNRNGHTW